ncbi:hypothetical protein TeGR_g485 [Tetraparma gracilis]|uniref:Succinate dehydrogenase assembly factor 4, mitochondrial n=1 Tax=Tetraparma gracilis TaxID=2962635 RepID=A0ABQ6NAR1_9STRA|nr:hypothetical protein TeGR_g485 [Tetraparma gracilis]
MSSLLLFRRSLPLSRRLAPLSLCPPPPPPSPSPRRFLSGQSADTALEKLKLSLDAMLAAPEPILKDACGDLPEPGEDDEDLEEMFVDTPMGKEWGGPTRGGRHAEPTMHGDWSRKGRCSDF